MSGRIHNVYLNVDCYGGRDIQDCIASMVDLADRLGIDIWCSLNGVRTLARPGNSAAALHEAWSDALMKKRTSCSV